MTALIGWIGVDERRPCSAYLMSDSRISWKGSTSRYDYGRKLFALRNNPDVLGYCGDVLFPSHVLSQIYELDCNGLLFPAAASSNEKSNIVFNQLQKQFLGYPTNLRNQVSIYHFSRDTDLSFQAFCYWYSPLSGLWERKVLEIEGSKSSLVICDGSGILEFKALYAKYQNGDIAGTSRNLFQCFCDYLHQTKDITCGGPPQLVGLYNGKKFNGMSFGIIYGGATYFCGSPCSSEQSNGAVRWYNENFEICDGTSLKRETGAMRQPNPNRLNLATP